MYESFCGQAGEVADAVAVAVVERANVNLVDDGVSVPQRIVGTSGTSHALMSSIRRMWAGTWAAGSSRT